MIERFAVVTTQFRALHNWPDAPDEVYYLRGRHRHIFKVNVHVEQKHNERDVEYIMLKQWLENEVLFRYHKQDVGSLSCEAMAEQIVRDVQKRHPSRYLVVSVLEDGENGAVLTFDPSRPDNGTLVVSGNVKVARGGSGASSSGGFLPAI